MPIVEPTNTEVKGFRGLHLYHAGRSNCSGRVRLLLEEKGLAWTSRYVDIYARANVSADYFGINPKGLVPTLVHDGRVVTESNDILAYIEEQFPEPGFSPAAPDDRALMDKWLERSGALHIPAVKTFAYAKRNAALVKKSPEEVALYRSLQTDPELLAFHAKHDLPGARFSEEDVAGAFALLDEVFREMDAILAGAPWLVGGVYSLADISWAPTMTTLGRAGFTLDAYPNLAAWYARIGARGAFKRAVVAWSENPIMGVAEMPAAS